MQAQAAPVATTGTDPVERATMARINRRLVPVLMLCYLVAFLDRVNVGFAALTMNRDIGLSATAYGWGAGIFFIGYFFFEVPSNMMLERFGARRWIARIMVSWGLVSGCMALVTGPVSFSVVRLLLGIAEAGFFPGVILYLTYWYPARHRAKVISIFMMAIPVSSFLGSPISGLLLGMDGMAGLRGWQWLFVLEAVPSVLLGVVVLFLLPSTPREAAWLDPQGRDWLEAALRHDAEAAGAQAHESLWQTLRHPRVLVLSLVYAGSVATSYGLTLWQPQIIKAFGLTDFQTGLVNAIPFGLGAITMIWWGRRSDRTGERVWNTAIPLLVAAVGLAASTLLHGPVPVITALCVAVIGTYALKGPFWAMSTDWLAAGSAAAGIAAINSLGNLAGFVGPFLIGWIKDGTGSFSLALLPLIALALVAALAVLVMGRSQARAAAPSSPKLAGAD